MPCYPGKRILKNAVLSSTIKCSLACMTLFLCLCSMHVFVLSQMWDEPYTSTVYIILLLLLLLLKKEEKD